jgi:transcription elongation factor GreA
MVRIGIGSNVAVTDVGDSHGTEAFQIVPNEEADAHAGMLSTESPLGRALIGRQEGDSVTFRAPGGRRSVVIVSVR